METGRPATRRGFEPSYLVRGLPGHPLHPPLTDVAVGAYTLGTLFAVLSVVGVSEENTATAWWLSLVVALVATVPTALSGFLDWLRIEVGTPMWRTATAHLASNLLASALFLVTLILGHDGYVDREVEGVPLVLNLIAFGMLLVGGWLGGAIVFVHGMRVLELPEEPAGQAASPVPAAEEEAAER